MRKIFFKTEVISFILMTGFFLATCSPYFLAYDNPVDPRADSYNGYKTVASVGEVTGDWPPEGTEVVWCVFHSSVVIDGGSDRYALQIDASTGDFSGPVYEDLDSSSNVFYSELTEGNYLYRVKARPVGGEWPEDWSEEVSFSGVCGVDLVSVNLGNGSWSADTTPLLEWEEVEGAVTYEIEVASGLDEIDGAGIEIVRSRSYQVPETYSFSYGDTCHWRIRSVDENSTKGFWSSVMSFDIREPEIGDSYAGGIIFYIDSSGFGLVAAEKDQAGFFGVKWSEKGTDINGADSEEAPELTVIGSGAENTEAIVETLGQSSGGNYAAKLCDDLELNGYNDWFLPSRDELDLMYNNLHSWGLGNFSNSDYWSSSEYDEDHAWLQDFYNGVQYATSQHIYFYESGESHTLNYYKDDRNRVRAVRAFTIE